MSDSTGQVTEGTLFEGAVRFAQLSTGYRAAIDGLLLAHFAPRGRHKRAADLGAGAGMVSLSLLAHEQVERLLAIEWHAPTAAVLEKNLADNALSARAQVIVGPVDVVARAFRGAADLVVANPPYFERSRSTVGLDPVNELAVRAESPLAPFVRAARLLLGRGGRACFVFPSRDLQALLSDLADKGLYARRMAFVHPRRDEPANRVLVEASVGRTGGLTIEPAWVLHEPVDNGARMEESALLRAVTRGPLPRSNSLDTASACP